MFDVYVQLRVMAAPAGPGRPGAGAVRQLEGRRRSASRRGSAAPRIPVL